MSTEYDTADLGYFLEAQARREGGWCLACGEQPVAPGEDHCAGCLAGPSPDDGNPLIPWPTAPHCPRCGLLTPKEGICGVCQYEIAHPGRAIFAPLIRSEAVASAATVPVRGFGGLRSGAAVPQVYQWAGVHREAG